MNNFRPTYDNNSTISAFFRFNLSAIGQYHALASQYIDGDNNMFMTVVSTNILQFQFKVGGASYRADGASTLSAGVDYVVGFIKDGTTLKIFLNGVEETYGLQEAYAHGSFAPAVDVKIGDRGGLPFYGKMFDFGFY